MTVSARKRISLVKRRAAPVPAVIALAESLLRRAKSGELRTFAYAGETHGHGMTSAWVLEDDTSRAGTYLALAQLLRRMEVPEVEVMADILGVSS